MRQRSALRTFLLGTGAAFSLTVLASCSDNTTGQDPEPFGPLLVTRLTLLDGTRGVFTDTSAPLDCSLDSLKSTPACVNDPFMDMYSPKKSPPTVDSASKLRVVFNKLPAKLNGQDIESAPADGSLPKSLADLQLKDPNVVTLTCEGTGCGVPPSYNSLQESGSALSPNPTLFDYGPALQMQVMAMYDPMAMPGLVSDPLSALEPSTTYHVVVNPGLSGRDLNPVQLDDHAKALLSFTTEPLQVLAIGFGMGDTAVSKVMGDGTVASPYPIASMPYDGVATFDLNAPIDEATFLANTVSATISVNGGAAMPVAVKLTNGIGTAGMKGCTRANKRTLYIAPASGQWVPPKSAAIVTLTVRGVDIRDVSQLTGHPAKMGRHVLSGDVVLQATVSSTGMTASAAMAPAAADVLACQ